MVTALALLFQLSTVYAIPIDLSNEDSEKLKIGLEKCINGIEKQFGVKFIAFVNYDVRTQKDTFVVFADIVATLSGSPPPSNKPDENTRYFQCTASLKQQTWQIEFKPHIIKTKEKGTFQPPDLNEYRLEAQTYVDMGNGNMDETRSEKWINEKGQIILKFITHGKTWAWGVLGNPSDRTNDANNFSLIDSDGDGVLDEKYPIYMKFPFPDWLKDKGKK